jgi:hypothetical protein
VLSVAALVLFFLQQDLWQQLFFVDGLVCCANVAPLINKAAIDNMNTFFMFI